MLRKDEDLLDVMLLKLNTFMFISCTTKRIINLSLKN